MQVQIEQSFAKIGLEHSDSKVQVESAKADFQLEKPPIRLDINSESADLDIDYTAALADLGIYNPFDFGDKMAQDGLNASMQGIAEYAREGDELARIENEGDPIVAQAARGMRKFDIEGVELAPKRPADVSVAPGEIEINIETDNVRTYAQPNPVRVDANRARIDTYLRQEAELEINFVDIKA